MSRTTNRLAFTVVATVGLMWPVLVLSATAAADPPLSVPACRAWTWCRISLPRLRHSRIAADGRIRAGRARTGRASAGPGYRSHGRPDGPGRTRPGPGARRGATTSARCGCPVERRRCRCRASRCTARPACDDAPVQRQPWAGANDADCERERLEVPDEPERPLMADPAVAFVFWEMVDPRPIPVVFHHGQDRVLPDRPHDR